VEPPTPEQRLRLLERRVSALEAKLATRPALEWTPVPDPAPGQPPSAQPQRLPPMAASVERKPADPMLAVRWLARAGILVLALGVLFFLKLAYDRGWVPIPGRFAIGILGGLVLFAMGELMRSRRMDSAVSQVFAGGGAVIAYTTLYVGYALPDYRAALGMTRDLDILLLATVSALLAGYAVARNLPVLAGVAVALIHVLVAPAGDFSTVGLVFVAALDIALLAAAAFRGWTSITALALVGATLVHVVAANLATVPWPLPVATALAIYGLGTVAAHRSKGERTASLLSAALAGAGMLLVAGAALSRGKVQDAWAWSALAVGLASLAGAVASRRLAPALAAVGAVLLLAWPFLMFATAATQILALALLAVAAALASMAFQGKTGAWVQGGALAACAVALLTLAAAVAADGLKLPIDQLQAVGGAALCLALGGFLFGALRGQPEHGLPIRILALAVAAAAPAAAIPVLLHGWLVAVAWAAEALVAVVLGLTLDDAEVRTASFALFGLVLARVFLVDLSQLSLPARVLAFLATGALLLAGAFLYARQRRSPPQAARPGP
jgi:uncharacterized membrane protein